jgi:MFS family permease
LDTLVGGLPRSFWILWAGMFVNRAGCFVVPLMALYLTQGRGFSIATAGVVTACYGAGAAVASPLGGYLADHAGRRRTMIGALAFGGLGMIGLGFVRDIRVIAPACFFLAMAGECYRPAMQAAVADLIEPRERVRAYGILYWVINLGFSIGAVLGGLLASKSFLLLFLGDGLTSLAFGAIVWRWVPETRPSHPATHSGTPRLNAVQGFLAPYRDRPFLIFVLLGILILLVFMQHVAPLPIDMAARGVSRPMIGLLLGINGVLIVLVQPFLAPWIQRLNRSRVIALGATLVGAGFGLQALARGPAIFAISVAIWTIGEICVLPIANAVVADVALPHMRGRYQGAYGLSFGLAGFGAPLIGTAVMQRWGSGALWTGCFVTGLVVAAGQLALAPRLTRLRESRLASRPAH